MKYLNLQGLQILWNKVKSSFLTKEEANSTYAKRQNPNDFVCYSNEIIFIPGNFNNELFINYRSSNMNQKSNISTYSIFNGGGSYSQIKAKGFIVNNSNSNQILLGDGSTISKDELLSELSLRITQLENKSN